MDNPQFNSLTLVVTLTIRGEAVETFREFERKAARIMVKYGGMIERTVVIPPKTPGEFLKEIHIVTFPDDAAFQAYRQDEETLTIAPLREASVIKTEIWIGKRGPDYLKTDG